ncbi:MAG: peptidase M48 Ste24p [Chitinophagaceae bacterium]|nr:MAG: peptidase M48 Ste24p [Chitinophagaceae bacterium]
MLLLLCGSAGTLRAQLANPYEYPVLSHLAHGRLRDSLKKSWSVPSVFKDKETQKKFREFWEGRTEFVVNAIDNKDFIQETELHAFVDGILGQICSANRDLIPQKPVLLIDRSASVNAYSVGGHLIAVNLGLISFARSREEIALVIAHELSHDILDHAGRSMRERAEWLTSEEYKKSLNEVLDSRYERYTRLKKVLEGYTFSRTRHNRYHEGEADSLAVVLLKNGKIAFDPASFLRLDSSDMQYQRPLAQPVKEYFTAMGLPFEDSWARKATKGLSSRNYSFNKGKENADSLKTHPDCKDRYARTLPWSTVSGPLTPVPATVMAKASKIILWNLFDNQNLTACLYRVLQEKDAGNTDAWYTFMMYNVFFGLYYSDNELNRFNVVKIRSKEEVAPSYFDLQTMLEQMPRESLEQYYRQFGALGFWQELPPDARGLKPLFSTLLQKEGTPKEREAAAKSFRSAHPQSMYCEFAEHFSK